MKAVYPTSSTLISLNVSSNWNDTIIKYKNIVKYSTFSLFMECNIIRNIANWIPQINNLVHIDYPEYHNNTCIQSRLQWKHEVNIWQEIISNYVHKNLNDSNKKWSLIIIWNTNIFYEDDSLNREEKMAETSGYRNKKKVLSEDFLSQPLLEVPQQLILLRCVAHTQ